MSINKTLLSDYSVPTDSIGRLSKLLDRTFDYFGLELSDTDVNWNKKFVDELIKTEMTSLTGQVAFDGWRKATGQENEPLDYSEMSVLIGTLAIMLGDIPSPSIKLDEIMSKWK